MDGEGPEDFPREEIEFTVDWKHHCAYPSDSLPEVVEDLIRNYLNGK